MLCAIPAAQHIQKDHSLCHSSGHGHPRLSELEFTPQQRTEKDLAQRFSYPAEQRAVGHPWPKTQVVWMNSASAMCCGRLRSSLCTAAQLHSCQGGPSCSSSTWENTPPVPEASEDACVLLSFWGLFFPALQLLWTQPTVTFLLSLWLVL